MEGIEVTRHRILKTHCRKGLHRFTPHNTRIEVVVCNGVRWEVRRCKKCQYLRWKDWFAKRTTQQESTNDQN
jgi:hypothetical protein